MEVGKSVDNIALADSSLIDAYLNHTFPYGIEFPYGGEWSAGGLEVLSRPPLASLGRVCPCFPERPL